MSEVLTPDVCVIGAGAGGLSVAAGAAQMGASVVLIERGRMGGDCLNYGCVPSKTLIAAARAAQGARTAQRFGVRASEPAIDAHAVFARVRAVITAIAPNDSVERFEGLGARVIAAPARFIAPDRVAAGNIEIRARRFVVATGSSPSIPPLPGLDAVPYLTNETVFDLDLIPKHLVVLGGGPIGIELAQAFRRLGARVSVIEMNAILAREDAELADVVRRRLIREGVDLVEGTRAERALRAESGVALDLIGADGEKTRLEGSHLLIAVGRTPNLAGLDLDQANIETDPSGIRVDARLRTSNPRVFAVGDVAGHGGGGLQFTHVANYHAGVVLKNILLRWPAKTDLRAIPRVVYADPELAQVGLTEAAAHAQDRTVRILRWSLHDNDRARTDDATDGLVKIVATPRGKILGAGIAAAHAGELIQSWTLALNEGLGLAVMARMVAPYPTLGEAGKRAAASFFAPIVFGARTRRLVRLLARLG